MPSRGVLSGGDCAFSEKHSWEQKHYETDLAVIKYSADDQIPGRLMQAVKLEWI